MDISDFFQPVPRWNREGEQKRLGDSIQIYFEDFPSLDEVQVALFGVEEDRLKRDYIEEGSSVFPIRDAFYNLYNFDFSIEIADLGTIQAGKTYEDTIFAVRHVCEYLIKKNIIPVIIGGSQDLTVANYLAYEKLEHDIDSQEDLDKRFKGAIDFYTKNASEFMLLLKTIDATR